MRIQVFRLLTVLCLQLPLIFAQEATTKAANQDPLVTGESDYVLRACLKSGRGVMHWPLGV
jgi:hypothetical protein